MSQFSFTKNIRSSAAHLRNPGLPDDASRGNVVNGVGGWTGSSRLWLNSLTGQFFTCTDNTNGAAVWADAGTPTALPGDAVAGVKACYGTKALKSSWLNGNLFRVQRKSDNTQQDIAAVGGLCDVASLNSFLSGTIGRVVTWYDQSGGGNDATQGTFASAPAIRVVGVEVYLVFDYISDPPVKNVFLTLPAVSWGTSFSLFQQSALTNCIGGAQFAMFELGTDTSNFQAYFTKSPSSNSWSDQTRVNLTATYLTTADCNPTPFSFISGSAAGSATAYWGERPVTNGNWKTLGTPVGGLIGKSVQPTGGPFKFDGTMQAFMVWDNLAMSTSQALSVRKAMYQALHTVPQCYNDIIVFDGDSEFSADHAYFPQISTSITGGGGYIMSVQLAALIQRPCRWVNTAISGEQLTQINAAYATRDAPLIDPFAHSRIMVLQGGEHEGDSLGDTPAQAFTILQSLCNTIKATSNPAWTSLFYTNMASYNAAVNDGSGHRMEDWRLGINGVTPPGYNALIAAGPLNIDGLIEVGATSQMGPLNAYTNTTYFWTDGIHWNAAAHGVVAALIAAKVNAALGAW